jgi:hypothetical protein
MLDINDPRARKLQSFIDEGKASVMSALQSIQGEFEIRRDRQVRPPAMTWGYKDALTLELAGDDQGYRFTDHSEGQVMDRVGLPRTYAKTLLTLDQPRPDLLLHNLNELMPQTIAQGALVRTVGTMAKGFLSPSYRRMDAAPILESFLDSALKSGYVPYRGANTDFRYAIIMVYPQVFQPAENEFVAMGVQIMTGDYGQQALSLSMMVLRIVCRNLATGMQMLRKVHLGSRFDMGDHDQIDLSDRTYKLDSATVASLTRDMVKASTDNIKLLASGISKANQTELTDDKATRIYETLKKRGVKKDLVDGIKTAYENTPPTIELLPPTKSLWRMSNAISLIANNEKLSQDTKIDLEGEAFSLLGMDKVAPSNEPRML